MIRCRECVIPDTRPDTPFVDGVCSACLSFKKRREVDWGARRRELADLLERGRNGSGYDCIVPSSGGKDSTWQVLTLIKMGAKPLVVTASTCHLTPIGRANIDNLARFATTYEVSPNKELRAKLNRFGMEMVGDISWPEHVSIFTTPVRLAVTLGIPLLFYGENPQEAYGGPQGSEEAKVMTQRWVSEFGGFLGLRPSDFGTMGYDMTDYLPPSDEQMRKVGIERHFLGAYFEWDSERNATVAAENGMRQELPCDANWWPAENLDNAQTGLHDHAMFRKYGYGRGAAQISVDVRAGRITRHGALGWVEKFDGRFPEVYADVPVDEVLAKIDCDRAWLKEHLDAHTNWELFKGEECLSLTA